MKLKGLILIPSNFSDSDIKFDMDVFVASTDGGDLLELNLIRVNCSSLSSMANKISSYFNEVIRRSPTETNILMAAYLGMMDRLLKDYPRGFPIRQDILDIIHQEDQNRHITSSTGYYFQFKVDEWNGVQNAVANAMRAHQF